MSQLLRLHFTHLIVFSILIFIAFFIQENGDMGVVILGTALYVPYAFILTSVNYFVLRFGLAKFTDQRLQILFVMLPVAILLTWFFWVNKLIQIRYWKLNEMEFWTLIIAMTVLNMATYILVRLNKDSQPIT